MLVCKSLKVKMGAQALPYAMGTQMKRWTEKLVPLLRSSASQLNN